MDIDIDHISKLSKLEIEEEKKEQFKKDMEKIVDMVNDLPDFEKVEDILDPNSTMKLREDVVEENKFKREELLENAPEVESGCIVVPKTVE